MSCQSSLCGRFLGKPKVLVAVQVTLILFGGIDDQFENYSYASRERSMLELSWRALQMAS